MPIVGDKVMPAELRMFATRLRKLREDRGVTQGALARQLGMDLSYLNNIENMQANPSIAVMSRLATAVGAELCDMICMTPAHGPAPARPA